MQETEETCGKELFASAVVVEQIARLLVHVSINLRDHARWVGTQSAEAAAEHAALSAVADGYEGISAEAQRVCNLMRSYKDLPPAPHDPERMDPQRFVSWMQSKIVLQRQLAVLLTEHAEASEQVLREMGHNP